MTVAVQVQTKSGSLIGGTLLISGTCIGGGMLAMPVQTAESGFFVTVLYLFIAWAFMTLSGLFLVEATLFLKKEAHYYSLSKQLIGRGAQKLALIVYLFMNYTSLVAYTVGGAQLIHHWITKMTNISLGYISCSIIFNGLLSLFVYVGAKAVGKINAILMVGLIITYFALVGMSTGIIKRELLFIHPLWFGGASVFSVILSAFSYQMIVPSICSYLHYDAAKLKIAIILGTLLPCCVYLLWQFVIDGVIPLDGEHGLRQALLDGSAATNSLSFYFKHEAVSYIADSFAFFTITTSFLGLSLALFQFLKDCFKGSRFGISNNWIIFLSAIPVILLSTIFPKALITCFDITGGFGDTILSGLIPLVMVWCGRYRKKYHSECMVFGGKSVLIVCSLFFFFIFVGEIVKVFGDFLPAY